MPDHNIMAARAVNGLAADDTIFSCDVGAPTIWAARFHSLYIFVGRALHSMFRAETSTLGQCNRGRSRCPRPLDALGDP
jgi:thiamine pyrophosphate-dependent acetolactate synthase large subunit-like protein